MGHVQFRILAVCTGNICRSPIVERLLQYRFSGFDGGAFEVRSAGIRALAGRPMTPQIATLASRLGASTDGFEARQLTPGLLSGVDLVLGLTREHRSKVLELRADLLSRTFTLRELARMVRAALRAEPEGRWPEDSVNKWKELLTTAASYRHLTMATAPEDDVTDPYRLDEVAHSQVMTEVLPAIEALRQFQRSVGSAVAASHQKWAGE